MKDAVIHSKTQGQRTTKGVTDFARSANSRDSSERTDLTSLSSHRPNKESSPSDPPSTMLQQLYGWCYLCHESASNQALP